MMVTMGLHDRSSGVENVFGKGRGKPLATIVRSNYSAPGISFVTDNNSVHQIGVLCWPRGHLVDAHIHNPLPRSIDSTQEVLFIRNGRVRLDLYNDDQTYECSRELETGDVVFLASGGHGFEMLEETEIIEVKQGPYMGENEKTRFIPKGNPYMETSSDV